MRFLVLVLAVLHLSCAQSQDKKFISPLPDHLQVKKTEAEWKDVLSSQEYYVLREKGTERAFTGKYVDNKEKGVYICNACKNPLFSSESKFKSGTGWPSFYETIKEGYVGEISDKTYGMVRTEVVCNFCGGHLGHVFDDGPAPTGLRYCINSVSLDFTSNPDEKILPLLPKK